MFQPILLMIFTKIKGYPLFCTSVEITIAAFNLSGYNLTSRVILISNINFCINTIIIYCLFSKKPSKISIYNILNSTYSFSISVFHDVKPSNQYSFSVDKNFFLLHFSEWRPLYRLYLSIAFNMPILASFYHIYPPKSTDLFLDSVFVLYVAQSLFLKRAICNTKNLKNLLTSIIKPGIIKIPRVRLRKYKRSPSIIE